MSPTFGSLFSGIGCIDRGLERAGLAPRWQIELDAACRQVLAQHWPDVPRHTDVREVVGDALAPVDLICGGFPCQDLSVAGRRAGLAGARSGLFYEFMRLVAERAPRWVLIENVPGLLSSNGGRDMGAIVGTLGELGYGWAYRVLDAQYFGVAQRRRRVFIVGCLGDAARAAAVLFESASGDGDSAPRREAGQRAAYTLEARSGGIKPAWNYSYITPDDAVAGGQTARYGKGTDSEATDALVFSTTGQGWGNEGPGTLRADAGGMEQTGHLVTHALTAEGCDASEDGTGRGTPLVACPAPVAFHATQTPVSGAQCRALGASAQCGVAFVSENQRHELRETDYARQLTTGGGKPGQGYPAVRDGLVVRRLTPTECERLMALPDGWTAGHPDTTRYRMLGNGAVTTVVEWIGRRLLEASA